MYTVVRDTREHEGHGWYFDLSEDCEGTVIRRLSTGDYTIEGLENVFTVDRKGSVGEFYSNLWESRFLRELDRMRTYDYAAILLEFTLEDLLRFPVGSGIPKSRWPLLKFDATQLLDRFVKIRLGYPEVDFLFAGRAGKATVEALFRRFARRLEENFLSA